MSTKDNQLFLAVATDQDRLSSFAEQVARRAGWRYADLRTVQPDELFRRLLAEFLWATRRVVIVTVLDAQLSVLSVADRRMLTRLLGGTDARLVSTNPLKTPSMGLVEEPQAVLEPSRGIVGGFKGWLPFRLPTPRGEPIRDAATLYATLRGGLGVGVYPAYPGLGVAGATALVVGDRLNTCWARHHPTLDWPFISAQKNGCSAWLAERLEEGGVAEEDLHWVDAYTARDTAISAVFVGQMNPRIIVALGKHAARWCSNNGLKYKETHHPEYWRRYQPGKRYILPRLLKGD